jgi:hypothetical protein
VQSEIDPHARRKDKMKTALAFVLTLASILIACGGDNDETPAPSPTEEPAAEIPVVEITKTDEGFEAPDSIPGGLTRFRVHNASTAQHAVSFERFRGDGTLEEHTAAYRLGLTDFAASAAAIGRLTTVEGGIGNIAPGGEAEVVLDLVPGRYVILRFPLNTGLSRELEVTAAPDARPAPPESDFTVSMIEFAFDGFPDTLPAGETTVEVVNEGAQFHLMFVQRVNEEGITAEQVSQHLGGTPLPVAPSYSAAGGMGELEPGGGSGWVTLDLDPGVYRLICTVFDQSDDAVGPVSSERGALSGVGKLHVDLGMHHAFTVQ